MIRSSDDRGSANKGKPIGLSKKCRVMLGVRSFQVATTNGNMHYKNVQSRTTSRYMYALSNARSSLTSAWVTVTAPHTCENKHIMQLTATQTNIRAQSPLHVTAWRVKVDTQTRLINIKATKESAGDGSHKKPNRWNKRKRNPRIHAYKVHGEMFVKQHRTNTNKRQMESMVKVVCCNCRF